ncbi:unnamed protein product [Amoebophrya sp. A120]|nr:unnamed protein product [Amoebophrya sp. A120]|eukprot:GSA120T00013439001.1
MRMKSSRKRWMVAPTDLRCVVSVVLSSCQLLHTTTTTSTLIAAALRLPGLEEEGHWNHEWSRITTSHIQGAAGRQKVQRNKISFPQTVRQIPSPLDVITQSEPTGDSPDEVFADDSESAFPVAKQEWLDDLVNEQDPANGNLETPPCDCECCFVSEKASVTTASSKDNVLSFLFRKSITTTASSKQDVVETTTKAAAPVCDVLPPEIREGNNVVAEVGDKEIKEKKILDADANTGGDSSLFKTYQKVEDTERIAREQFTPQKKNAIVKRCVNLRTGLADTSGRQQCLMQDSRKKPLDLSFFCLRECEQGKKPNGKKFVTDSLASNQSGVEGERKLELCKPKCKPGASSAPCEASYPPKKPVDQTVDVPEPPAEVKGDDDDARKDLGYQGPIEAEKAETEYEVEDVKPDVKAAEGRNEKIMQEAVQDAEEVMKLL